MTETITLVVQILLSSTTKPKLLTPQLLTRVIVKATMEMLGTEAV